MAAAGPSRGDDQDARRAAGGDGHLRQAALTLTLRRADRQGALPAVASVLLDSSRSASTEALRADGTQLSPTTMITQAAMIAIDRVASRPFITRSRVAVPWRPGAAIGISRPAFQIAARSVTSQLA